MKGPTAAAPGRTTSLGLHSASPGGVQLTLAGRQSPSPIDGGHPPCGAPGTWAPPGPAKGARGPLKIGHQSACCNWSMGRTSNGDSDQHTTRWGPNGQVGGIPLICAGLPVAHPRVYACTVRTVRTAKSPPPTPSAGALVRGGGAAATRCPLRQRTATPAVPHRHGHTPPPRPPPRRSAAPLRPASRHGAPAVLAPAMGAPVRHTLGEVPLPEGLCGQPRELWIAPARILVSRGARRASSRPPPALSYPRVPPPPPRSLCLIVARHPVTTAPPPTPARRSLCAAAFAPSPPPRHPLPDPHFGPSHPTHTPGGVAPTPSREGVFRGAAVAPPLGVSRCGLPCVPPLPPPPLLPPLSLLPLSLAPRGREGVVGGAWGRDRRGEAWRVEAGGVRRGGVTAVTSSLPCAAPTCR